MKTKFVCNWEQDNISQIKVIRENAYSIVFECPTTGKEITKLKKCPNTYFSTWKEAHKYLLDTAHKRVDKTCKDMQNAIIKLRVVGRLKPDMETV